MNEPTREERRRHVRVAARAVNEERRVGLITGAEALRKIRALHEENGWPFGELLNDKIKTVDKTVTWTGWGNTDAKAAMNCPKCGALAGEECAPKGRKTKGGVPHAERYKALLDTGYTANRVINCCSIKEGSTDGSPKNARRALGGPRSRRY